jgi:gamma-glutamyltranspeptidase
MSNGLRKQRIGRARLLKDWPGHANVVAPGKKTMRALNSNMLCRDGRPWIVGGTPGGDRQVQWNVQAITLLLTDAMLPVGV